MITLSSSSRLFRQIVDSQPTYQRKINSSLKTVHIFEHKITDLFNQLNTGKAHGPDDISIRMLKLCTSKYSYVVPIRKKGNRQVKSN